MSVSAKNPASPPYSPTEVRHLHSHSTDNGNTFFKVVLYQKKWAKAIAIAECKYLKKKNQWIEKKQWINILLFTSALYTDCEMSIVCWNETKWKITTKLWYHGICCIYVILTSCNFHFFQLTHTATRYHNLQHTVFQCKWFCTDLAFL